MAAIDIVVSGVDVVEAPALQDGQLVGNTDPTKRGRIIQENYVLNDAAALKKKLLNETNKKEAYNSGKDAKDGSNVVTLMKTSFFEYLKSSFIQDLFKHEDISLIENAVATKAQTANSGDAFVEYAMMITFEAENTSHAIKFHCVSYNMQVYDPAHVGKGEDS